MIAKQKYRINNWEKYNKSLIQRGSITVWFSHDAILTALLLRSVFHLPLRALQGFMMPLVMLMNIAIPIPYHTQICRRAKLLGKSLRYFRRKMQKMSL